MQELGRQAIQKAYPEGDYLLDLEDEYGSIVLSPREVWEHLWKTYVPDEQKDDAIIENEQEIKAAYDPSLPITVFYKQYQRGKTLLTKLNAAPTEITMFRNALSNLKKHAHLSRECRKWREKTSGNASALNINRDNLKTHFT